MQKLKKGFVIVFMLIGGALSAQRPELVQTYINNYKDLAIAEMLRSGIPASITLAQGIYESTAGTSELVLSSNNHFGIKCNNTWTGESVKHDDDLRNECFRKYPCAEDSYKDHSDFLRYRPRYAFLFNIDPTDYKGWAKGLKKAGYATSPKYPQSLIKLIEDYNLQEYTLQALQQKENLSSRHPNP
jgi:flagellum-specific peptidoglycan hydrolase FlgJ